MYICIYIMYVYVYVYIYVVTFIYIYTHCKWQQVSYGRELQVDEKPCPTDPSVTERQLSFLQSSKVNASLVAEPRQCTDG